MPRRGAEPTRRSEKHRRSAESRRGASASLLLLAWLEGFPDGDGWIRYEGGAPVAVDGALVARTRRAARTAMREYPQALAGLVGDVERWWGITDAVLAWCAQRSGPLDLIDRAPPRVARQARELAARRPELRETIAAAGVALAQRPEELARVLAWLAPRAEALAAVGAALAVAGSGGGGAGRGAGGAGAARGAGAGAARGAGAGTARAAGAGAARGAGAGAARGAGAGAARAAGAGAARGASAGAARGAGAGAARVAGARSSAAPRATAIHPPTALALAWLSGDAAGAGRGPTGEAAVARGVDELIALLSVDAPDPEMSLAFVQHLRKQLHGGYQPAQAPVRSGPRAVAWARALLEREPKLRRRALALLGASALADALAPWAAWEQEHVDRIARAEAFAARGLHRTQEQLPAARIDASLAAAVGGAPGKLALEPALAELDSCAENERYHAAIARLLAALPAAPVPLSSDERRSIGSPADASGASPARRGRPHGAGWDAFSRAHMMIRLSQHASWLEDLRPSWLWDALADALERGADPRLIEPWRERLSHGEWYQLESPLLDALARRGEAQRLVSVLEGLVARGAWGATPRPARVPRVDGARAAAWLAAGLSDDEIIDLVCELRETHGALTPEIARAARSLGDGTTTSIAARTRDLFTATEELQSTETRALAQLLSHLAAHGAAWLARGALEAGQARALVHAASLAELLPPARWPEAVAAPASAAWIARYPAALAPALHRLASVDPGAEATAARRLADDLPDPAALARELAALRARPSPPASIARRIASLEARLAAPKRPSAQRLARLAEKLDVTAAALGLERFTAAVTAQIEARFARAFGADALPPTHDRASRELALGLLDLDPRDRALAGRLLRARRGPRPWDLRDDPQNRAFLDRMRARGIDPAPWLDETPQLVEVAPTRRTSAAVPLELALCGDPLEVFAMGAHFQTCLSPGSINFFSVIANAADINKRVLYARRDGRVVGRCLLALTDEHGLLAFHPYCHEVVDFAAIVRDFALALATRMGTVLVPSGAVSTLVARDWYDDGPRDLVGRFRGLDQIEPRETKPEAIIGKLRETLGHDLDDVTLPLVLVLPWWSAFPELFRPLVPFLLASTTPWTRVTAAQIAKFVDLALADRLLGDYAGAVPLEHRAWPHGELVALLRPSQALARLRATRQVRRLADDTGDRLAVAGVALLALHRPLQAAALLRLAVEKEPWLKRELAPHFAALGGADRGEP